MSVSYVFLDLALLANGTEDLETDNMDVPQKIPKKKRKLPPITHLVPNVKKQKTKNKNQKRTSKQHNQARRKRNRERRQADKIAAKSLYATLKELQVLRITRTIN